VQTVLEVHTLQPVGHNRHELFNRYLPLLQDVQYEDIVLQVSQIEMQAEQTEPLIKNPLGQLVTHPLLYKYLPDAHVVQTVFEVHTLQFVEQGEQALFSRYLPDAQVVHFVEEVHTLQPVEQGEQALFSRYLPDAQVVHTVEEVHFAQPVEHV